MLDIAKSATTGRRNIIRVRVHQPGKQKDIYIHKAHLLNMIVLTVDIKSSIYRKCTEDKKKREIIPRVLCVRVYICMSVGMHGWINTCIPRACVLRLRGRGEEKNIRRSRG